MEAYKEYQNSICEIPSFLNKYLELPIMQRLRDISLLCGMDYASPYMYDFGFYISRYNHSLNVALITWKLTHDKTQTLAALFHDISTPVFSHVIDYMNGDYVKQESTEDKTSEILTSSKDLLLYLKEDSVEISDVINFKNYSVVDLPRPSLCADRLENLIGVGMAWVKEVKLFEAKDIINSIYLTKNENGQDEIALSSHLLADYLVYLNKKINALTHTDEDTYMMILLSDIVRRTIDEGLIIYDDLYRLTEHEYMSIIERNLSSDYELSDLWNHFKTVEEPLSLPNINIKELTLNPIYNDKRVN